MKLDDWFLRNFYFVLLFIFSPHFLPLAVGFRTRVKVWDAEASGHETGRGLRVSPIYTRMESHGKFGQNMAYERPLYFKKHDADESSSSKWDSYRPSVYRDSHLCRSWMLSILHFTFCSCFISVSFQADVIFCIN